METFHGSTNQPGEDAARQSVVPVPTGRAWFWRSRWQAREREVDEHVAAGRVRQFDDAHAFLGHLADKSW
jgi:hypothetical protein